MSKSYRLVQRITIDRFIDVELEEELTQQEINDLYSEELDIEDKEYIHIEYTLDFDCEVNNGIIEIYDEDNNILEVSN